MKSDLLTVGEASGLRDHWYLQPWMTDFRGNGGSDAGSPTAAPHPPETGGRQQRPALPTILPASFGMLRTSVVPATPLLAGGLHIGRPGNAVSLRFERYVVAGLLLAGLATYLAINAGYPEQLLRSVGFSATDPLLWPVAQAFYWSALSLVALAVWRSGLVATPRSSPPLVTVAAVAAVFQISLVVVAGVLLGFGRSPYAHGLLQMAANALYVAAVLVAVELCRACVVVVVGRTNPTVAVAVGTLVFTIARFPISRFTSLEGGSTAFSFFGGDLLPALAIGLVASVLALAGGPLPAIVYGGVLQGFEWLSPLLPNLGWATAAFVGTLGPVVVLSIIQPPPAPLTAMSGSVMPVPAIERPPARTHRWALATGLTAVTAIWFLGGFFGVQPVAVSGPSMTPTFHLGDLVIVQSVDAGEVAVGDVIRFAKGSTDVIHRVVEIRAEPGGLVFVTKGDSNNVADDPIVASDVSGRVVMVLPKLGWPSVVVRQFLART